MNTALVLSALLVTTGPRIAVAPEQVQPRFEAQCTGGKWSDAECPALRAELELQLHAELQLLRNRPETDRATLQAAARARFPMLAELGLRRLARINSPEDRDAVTVALDHPSPGVRDLARQMLLVQDDRFRKTLAPWFRAGGRSGIAGLVPDDLPEQAVVGLGGVKDLSGLRYRYFASNPSARRAVFTTSLSPDQVLALIARGSRVFDGTKLPDNTAMANAANDPSGENLQKQIEAAVARGDMKTMMELSQRVAAQVQKMIPEPMAAGLRAVPEFSTPPAGVRYVQLPGDKNRPPISAAVAREEAFGSTVLVIQY